jgi:hypothetical protein
MRPRDPVTGSMMPPPCRRYDMAPFYAAALEAISADPRAPSLTTRRKLELIDRAVNVLIDGDQIPYFVARNDPARPENHFMRDMFDLALARCRPVVLANLGGRAPWL